MAIASPKEDSEEIAEKERFIFDERMCLEETCNHMVQMKTHNIDEGGEFNCVAQGEPHVIYNLDPLIKWAEPNQVNDNSNQLGESILNQLETIEPISFLSPLHMAKKCGQDSNMVYLKRFGSYANHP